MESSTNRGCVGRDRIDRQCGMGVADSTTAESTITARARSRTPLRHMARGEAEWVHTPEPAQPVRDVGNTIRREKILVFRCLVFLLAAPNWPWHVP